MSCDVLDDHFPRMFRRRWGLPEPRPHLPCDTPTPVRSSLPGFGRRTKLLCAWQQLPNQTSLDGDA